jgi:hydrogenase-4 component E
MPPVHGLDFDIAHMLAGGMVAVSFVLLFQDRLTAQIHFVALHGLVLAAAMGWQAQIQHAPHLSFTASLAFVVKGLVIPIFLHRLVRRLAIHRSVETVVGIGITMLLGIALVALAVQVTMPVAARSPLVWEDLAFALSVVMLGLLLMITRRNAVSQVVGLLALDNGLMLAAAGARSMPFLIELSIAFSALVALIVFGVSLFRIRERFDTVDVQLLDLYRGDAP